MDKQLKPCPFCGGEAKVVSSTTQLPFSEEINYFEVTCTKCGITPYFSKEDNLYYKKNHKEIEEKLIQEVIEMWNRRINNG
jgi:Lar family restriction alleviation protein